MTSPLDIRESARAASSPRIRSGSWVMRMTWSDLLFMHWPVPADALRAYIPADLHLDTFDGMAWLGIVPFRMVDVRPRWMPPIPGAANFPELNVRTYVTHNDEQGNPGTPGVWFFSLDAASRLAVRGARLAWHLPYFDAAMTVMAEGDAIRYHSIRTHRQAHAASLKVRYRPTGPAYTSSDGSLDHFLTHRLYLYSASRRGTIFRGAIDHAPWPLQPAEAEIETNDMTSQLNLKLPDTPPILHFARRLDVLAWKLRKM